MAIEWTKTGKNFPIAFLEGEEEGREEKKYSLHPQFFYEISIVEFEAKKL
jgi:hypothetical protein